MTIIHKPNNNIYFTLKVLQQHGVERVAEAIYEESGLKMKEPIKWLLDAMRVTYKDPTIYFVAKRGQAVEVIQAGVPMGTLDVFTPSGDVRSAVQAEVSSDLIKNRKAPTNSKRSSTRAKAEKLVELLHYYNPAEYAEKLFSMGEWNLHNLIKKSVPVDSIVKTMSDLVRRLHYSDDYAFLARLMRSSPAPGDQEQIKSYLNSYDLFRDKQYEQQCLKNVLVMLQVLPPGIPNMYRMVTATRNNAAGITPHEYSFTTRDIPSMEALPDVIQSKLALLQLGSEPSAHMVGYQDKGVCRWLSFYGLIGEDLGEMLDTGRESKEGGDSLP